MWLLILAFQDGYLNAAVKFYKQGDYRNAIIQYEFALREEPLQADRIKFNIAQCWFALDTMGKAEELYREVYDRLPATEKSVALNNLGIISVRKKVSDKALQYFKQALIANPENDNARFNYEWILKKRQQDPPPPPPPPPSFSPPPPRQFPSENDVSGVPKAKSREEAKQQLEAIKLKEKQYLQEQRKRAKARVRYTDTPEW